MYIQSAETWVTTDIPTSHGQIYRIKSYEKARPIMDVRRWTRSASTAAIRWNIVCIFHSFSWWEIVQSKQGVENSAVMMSTNLPHQGHHQPALTRRFERQQPGAYQDRWSTSCVWALSCCFFFSSYPFIFSLLLLATVVVQLYKRCLE